MNYEIKDGKVYLDGKLVGRKTKDGWEAKYGFVWYAASDEDLAMWGVKE
jgi:hypothetical protein